MTQTTLQHAIEKGKTLVYLAEYDRRVMEPHTLVNQSDDGLTYTLVNQYGREWRYYEKKNNFIRLEAVYSY